MSVSGVRNCLILRERIDAGVYINLLSKNLEQTATRLGMTSSIFQKERAGPHNAKITKKWFNDNNINLLNWPAQSLDLKPIESLWDRLAAISSRHIYID